MEKAVLFTQGQAGGKKGSSTYDHLFLVRAMMTHACKNKQNLFLTFYDVEKAYDQADVGNMLHIMWKAGIKGKMWRLLRNLSTNLTATVKTNHGTSRRITMDNGGKQGSRLMCRKFSKQMDTLSENFIQKYPEGVCLSNDLKIGCLAYVDDIATGAIGIKDQKSVLNKVDDFAVTNKLEWGAHKCQVMQVGKKVTIPDKWQLGQKQISNTTTYKYLGDMLTNDNKNKKNIELRENKINAIIRQVNTTASSDIMRGIETKVIICLYHKCIIPSLLNNAESWTLSKSEEDTLDKVGIRAIKRLFNLPNSTPSVSVIFNFGLHYITQLVDQKRFLYLHKILQGDENNWLRKTFNHLYEKQIGWAENIVSKLEQYGLTTDLNIITRKTRSEWKNDVKKAVEQKNREKLITHCVTVTQGIETINTKTKYIYEKLSSTTYQYRTEPVPEIAQKDRQRAKTIMIARSGMLECGRNFKGTIPVICRECNVLDDENHRMNQCTMFGHGDDDISGRSTEFCNIFSEEENILNTAISQIEKVWELKYANGRMKR